ncbi:MAG: hypothetical protein JO261_08355 [Alphaproteobacteria bacterium]|nr:hypothetical protein [Alphaproteobacteria bacterium]MBV9693698.1 hypothetical protein [Alphaproteobacteria bacterium]
MSKYDRLGDYLRDRGWAEIPMSFAEIERIVGTKLPKSQENPAWWSNSTTNNVMTKVWLDAGYRTEKVNIAGRKLVFRRIAPVAAGGGMSESPSEYRQADDGVAKKSRRHPAFGALKGTFWIDPEWDLTKPTMSEEELDEMEANLERTADLIDAGFRKKPR